MRQFAQFPINDLEQLKHQLLAWANSFSTGVYLDSNEYPSPTHSTWECLVAVGVADSFQANAGQAFTDLQSFYNQKQDWLFGFLAYDLKNEVEQLQSNNRDGIGLPDLFFFQPEVVAGIQRRKEQLYLEIYTLDSPPDKIVSEINTTPSVQESPVAHSSKLTPRLPHADYLAAVSAVRQHIIEGDVYELNICQEFFADNTIIDPLSTFRRLNHLAKAPFAAYFRNQNHYLLCASPERFLRKTGTSLVSQPIKGTRSRHHADPKADSLARKELRDSIKDQAENIMIVDLVRNDLARHCLPGSIQVEELFGIYSFQTVHQMISTVTGTLRPEVHPIVALRDAFPMGSMTGAPKVMAMKLIEQYEHSRRGLFSGAIGYFTPTGDFDFNVVIRSILYNASTAYLSCQVGGAIVYDSVPEQEYEECLVKAAAMMEAIGHP